MKQFEFSVPQNILFGENSLEKLPEIARKLESKKVFIISGPHLKKMGTVDKIADMLLKDGIESTQFTETEANPSVETVEKAAALFSESKATSIVALGGGSPMDVAKAVGVVAKFGGKITEYEGADKVPGDIVPLIAIPTTAGTGSEVTAFSVITDHKRNYKLTVFSYKLIPAYAILDPVLLTSMPAMIAASTGVDALVHAIEAYLSTAASPFSDAMAEKAMELIGSNIRSFVANRKDIEAASGMFAGQLFAGIAFSWARLGNVHAMAHPLGGYFNVPHGVANAILLPTVLEFNSLADKGRYNVIYNYIARQPQEEFASHMLIDEVRNLTGELGIPSKLSDVGVTEDKIDLMAEDAMKSGNILVNPRSTSIQDIIMLYKKAL